MAKPTTPEVHDRLKDVFQRGIPSGEEIVKRAIAELLGAHKADADWIKAHFSDLVEKIQERAYEIYLEAEKEAGGRALRRVFTALAGSDPDPDAIFDLIEEYFSALDRFFLGLTQSRRPRAGAAFEHLIRDLFTRLGYPFTQRPAIDGRPDFLLPSAKYYSRNPLDCVIFTVKRTLRERWRQIVTEGTRALGFYLGTIDDKVGDGDLRDMMRAKIHLVVPARLKQRKYRSAGNVLSFEDFFEHHLDPAMRRWKAARSI